MNQIIEEIYESESKRSTELKRMDEEFEKQLNQLVEIFDARNIRKRQRDCY